MDLTLHITSSEHLDALVDRAVGPLDHQLGTIACADPELSPTRTRNVMRMRTRLAAGDYVVDADAVAGAIVDRLRPAAIVPQPQAVAV